MSLPKKHIVPSDYRQLDNLGMSVYLTYGSDQISNVPIIVASNFVSVALNSRIGKVISSPYIAGNE